MTPRLAKNTPAKPIINFSALINNFNFCTVLVISFHHHSSINPSSLWSTKRSVLKKDKTKRKKVTKRKMLSRRRFRNKKMEKGILLKTSQIKISNRIDWQSPRRQSPPPLGKNLRRIALLRLFAKISISLNPPSRKLKVLAPLVAADI